MSGAIDMSAPMLKGRVAELTGIRDQARGLRALAQRVEVGNGEVRIMGPKTELRRTRVAASGVGGATIGVRGLEPKWRARKDSNL